MSKDKQTEKICSGCGRSSLNPIGEQHIACCPDNNYIEMSNNKESMKLYTEIQLLEAIDKASLPNITIFDILEDLTPIQLPSDEDMQQYLNTLPYTKHLDDGQYNDGVIVGAEMGIEWMRDKIQGGNNGKAMDN